MSISCLIVGGGLVGRSLAYYLSRRQARVTLVDEMDPARDVSAATRASLGVLTRPTAGTDAFSTFYRISHELHAPLAQQLLDDTQIDVGYDRCGGLELAYDEETAAQLEQKCQRLLDRGATGQWLTGAQVMERAKVCRPGALAASWWAQDHRVDPVRLARALWQAAQQRGATFHQGTVSGIEAGPAIVLKDGQRLQADAVVLAGGARTTSQLTGLQVPERAVRSIPGQSLRVSAPLALAHILHGHDIHLLPCSAGRLRIGATVEAAADQVQPTEVAREALLTAARSLLACDDLIVEAHHAGLRPKPRRGRPLIAALETDGVYIASGHYKSGVLMAPATGRALARWLTTGDPGVDLSPFALTR